MVVVEWGYFERRVRGDNVGRERWNGEVGVVTVVRERQLTLGPGGDDDGDRHRGPGCRLARDKPRCWGWGSGRDSLIGSGSFSPQHGMAEWMGKVVPILFELQMLCLFPFAVRRHTTNRHSWLLHGISIDGLFRHAGTVPPSLQVSSGPAVAQQWPRHGAVPSWLRHGSFL